MVLSKTSHRFFFLVINESSNFRFLDIYLDVYKIKEKKLLRSLVIFCIEYSEVIVFSAWHGEKIKNMHTTFLFFRRQSILNKKVPKELRFFHSFTNN